MSHTPVSTYPTPDCRSQHLAIRRVDPFSARQGKLFITMSGGCQGCGSSQVTLRQGFEVMLKRVAPEIEEIVDTTNHAAGKQPFYPRHESGVDL